MLAARFRDRTRQSFEDTKGLEEALAQSLRDARDNNPGIALSDEAFVDTLAARVEPSKSAAAAVSALRADALYLVAACLSGDPAAIAAFEKRYFSKVGGALRALDGGAAIADDVRQELRIKLFAGKSPQLSGYRGKGDLGRWLSAIAVNAGLRVLGKRSREAPLSEKFAERIMGVGDPQSSTLKKMYGTKVKRALAAALSAQAPQARTELLQYYVEGKGVVELGALYRVAPSTISRRLAKTRDAVLADTRRLIEEELAVRTSEVDSIIRLVMSQLELSRSMLGPSP